MSKITISAVNFAALTGADYPAPGLYLIGIDLADGVLKKMDSDGVLTATEATIVVDGTTITGNGTVGNPLVATASAIEVDGVTITGDGTIGNPLVAEPQTVAVDGVTITGDGTGGNPLVAVASASPILTGNTVWVDVVNGNNGTGISGRQDLPFATIAAAQAVAASGDIIIIRPGSYTATNLGKAGVRYHFEDGAIVTAAGNMWVNTGAISYSVTGDGHFSASSSVLYTNAVAGSVIYFECKYAIGTGAGSRTIWLFGSADVTMHIKTDLVLSGLEATIRIDGATARLNLVCDRLIGVGGLIGFSGTVTANTLCNVTARQFIYNAAGGGYVGIDCSHAVLKMYGDVYFNGIGIYGLPAIYIGSATGVLEIHGNIYSTSTDGTLQANCKVDIHGDIVTSGNLITNGASAVIHYHGRIVSSVANAVTHTAGKTIIHDLVKATAGNGISVAAAGLILRQSAVIVATGDSVYAAGAQTIKTYPGAVASTALNVNITESVSTILVSASVDAE